MQNKTIACSRFARPRMLSIPALALATVLAAACGGGGGPSEAEQVAAQRGEVLSESSIGRLTPAQVDEKSAAAGVLAQTGPALCEVEVRSILHRTIGKEGEAATVSGALLVPGGAACPGPFPLIAYARGTDRDRMRALADVDDRETGLLMAAFAAHGYVVIATDYLGFAQSDYPFHPYLDAQTTANTVIDSIRAARASLAASGVPMTDRLFLAGYSQGGHAAVATHRAIDREQPAGIRVTASGPMAGPYDLETTLVGGALLLPRLVTTPGESLVDQVAFRFGEELLSEELLGLIAGRTSFLQALARNSVLDWTPQEPMTLCHGSRDTVVPFANAQRAFDEFSSRGAPVTLVDVEAIPEFAPALPPPDLPPSELSGYHNRVVPPLCFLVVRDRQFAPLR
jgi:predicted esterase